MISTTNEHTDTLPCPRLSNRQLMIKSVLANIALRKCYYKVIGGSLNSGLKASTMTLFLLKVSMIASTDILEEVL